MNSIINSTLNILEAIRYSGRKDDIKFYQASSSEMFGKNFTEKKAIPDNTKVIFPQAPKIKMSNGLKLTSWFDILPDKNQGKPYTDA